MGTLTILTSRSSCDLAAASSSRESTVDSPHHILFSQNYPTGATMADVEMTDAPTSAPASALATTKKGAAADGEAKEGKKRFEVKKVSDRHPGLGRSAAR